MHQPNFKLTPQQLYSVLYNYKHGEGCKTIDEVMTRAKADWEDAGNIPMEYEVLDHA